MVAPFGGPLAKLTFIETYISCVAGAIFFSALFYFAAEFFMKRAKTKRIQEIRFALENNLPIKRKRYFTAVNKFIVRIKKRFGFLVISMFAPLFLSVSLGSIVVAKFYGYRKDTFLFIVIGNCISGFVTTSIAYLIFQ